MESVTLEAIPEEPKKIITPKKEFHTVSLESLEREKSISRQQFMLQKKNEIESQLTHYTKVKNNWARADAAIKIVSTSVVVISSILSSIFFSRNRCTYSSCNIVWNSSTSNRFNRRNNDFIYY